MYSTVSLTPPDRRRVYLGVKYLFNISSCSTNRDRLRILQSIRLSARSISGQRVTVRGGLRGCPLHVPSVEDVCIDHRRTDVLMPKQLLNRQNIIQVFKQMGGDGAKTGSLIQADADILKDTFAGHRLHFPLADFAISTLHFS
jgi:hypothetical protein